MTIDRHEDNLRWLARRERADRRRLAIIIFVLVLSLSLGILSAWLR